MANKNKSFIIIGVSIIQCPLLFSSHHILPKKKKKMFIQVIKLNLKIE